MNPDKIKIALLDDYQDLALSMADFSQVDQQTDITVFHDHLAGLPDLIARLIPFEVVCVMRERTPLTRELLSALPNLRLIISTAPRNASIDLQAAADLGITIKHTGYVWSGAPELTWALLMALARKIPEENANFFNGRWQTTLGVDLKGKTMGIIGLGNIGQDIARFGLAFGMKVIAWSQNLDPEKAEKAGVRAVDKQTLFRDSDFISVHLVLSDRSRGIISKADLDLMKPTAFIINTSRGPLIVEQDLTDALREHKIAGAALDVFDAEPLPADHPLRTLDNLIATPHIGYVTEDTYAVFYRDTLKGIQEWIQER